MRRHAFILLLSVFVCAACERGTSIEGRYEAFDIEGRPVNLVLKLEADGRGSWSFGDDYVEIRWKVNGRRIVMHTKSGGVFTGTLVRGGQPHITISHANIGHYVFKKNLS